MRACWVVLVLLLSASPATAQVSIRVAAAADLQVALPEIARRFQQDTGIVVVPSFGSSGMFAAQIQQGAPFDVFMSADVAFPRMLAEKGFADRGAVVTYARGRLVLWTRQDSGMDVASGLKGLTVSAITRVAVANPEHAPYGRAAVAALQTLGIHEMVRTKFVLGENISQAAQFARTGNAQVAIIARALALGPDLAQAGRYAEVPATLHPPIDQGVVWLSRSKQPEAAKRFVAFLGTPETVAYLMRVGFEAAGSP
jgi:molybdate transport system substrate-binding protein